MKWYTFFLLSLLITPLSVLDAKIRVVTTTPDLAAIAKEVGEDRVDVVSLSKGYQNPHYVEAKPSFLLKLKKADVFVQIGRGLEAGWAPALLVNARNPKILPGAPGFMDASEGCEILQIPQGKVDRSLGDVHAEGNPHYWLTPANGGVIARRLADRFSLLDPGSSAEYAKALERFLQKLTRQEEEWTRRTLPLKGVKVVTYHNSWPNFAKRFGLDVVNFLEPKPGIPPSPAHIQSLIRQMKEEKVSLLLMEPYFDKKLPQKVAQETGSRLVLFPPSVGAEKDVKNYFELFDRLLDRLLDNRIR